MSRFRNNSGKTANILTLIMTSGLEYDDRLRKEVCSLSGMGSLVIIAACEHANENKSLVVYGGVPARTVKLWSRQWFKRTRGLIVKTIEMYMKFLFIVLREKPSSVWIHNLELAGLVPFLFILRKFGFINFIIWDQHELPSDHVLKSRNRTTAFIWMMNLCDRIIMANTERMEFLQKLTAPRLRPPISVLHNYPDKSFLDIPCNGLPVPLVHWLGDSPYLLAQGGAAPGRYFHELVEAVINARSVKLVIVGPYSDEDIAKLESAWGSRFSDNVYLTGMVPQMGVSAYIDNAQASIVLYSSNQMNENLCAPNRLYQALCRGIPVIVGSNPPMANIVGQSGCGIVLSSDGRDPLEISESIRLILEPSAEIKENAKKFRATYMWESQDKVMEQIIDGIHGIPPSSSAADQVEVVSRKVPDRPQ